MQFSLGAFIFELNTLAPKSVSHRAQAQWGSQKGVGKDVRPSYQATGIGEETITFSGVTYPEFFSQGEASLNGLWWMKNDQSGWYLSRGDGTVFGVYIIDSIEATYSHLNQDGTAKKIEFNLVLKRIEDSRSNMLGSLANALELGLF